jgi:hypothetical protein
MSRSVAKQARGILALYLRSIGLQDRPAIKDHTRRLLEKLPVVEDDAEIEAGELVGIAQQRVFDWITELIERLELEDVRDEMRGFLMLEVSQILFEHPEYFLEANDLLIEMLRERLADHAEMFPENEHPLEMPPQSLEDFPDLFEREALTEFLFEDLGLSKLFQKRRGGQNA